MPHSTAPSIFTYSNILLNKISGHFETLTPVEYASGKAKDYKLIDSAIEPHRRSFLCDSKAGEVPGLAKDEKLLLVCTKGKRAYLLQNRLKHYGYTNTLVLEGGTTFNEIEI